MLILILDFYFGNNFSKDTIENVAIALKERGVSIECEIPKFNKDIGTMSYSTDEVFNKSKMVTNILKISNMSLKEIQNFRMFENNGKKLVFIDSSTMSFEDNKSQYKLNTSSNFEVEKYIKKMCEQFNLPVSNFYVDSVSKNSDSNMLYILKEKYRGMIIYDNYIEAVVSVRGIKFIKCRYRKIKEIASAKKIMPAFQVLLKNFVGSNDIKIISIDIGFKEHIIETGIKELDDIPVWRVRTKDSGTKFFRAYNGELIQ